MLQKTGMINNQLFTPFTFKLSGRQMPNRIALAPMTNMQSHEDGTLSDDEYNWLIRRAAEGFGMIITCASHVAKDGQGWKGELGVYDDRHVPGLTRLATGIHAYGSLAVLQIFHGGARSAGNLTGIQPWSASEHMMPHAKEPVKVREATTGDITGVIEAFVAAAKRAHSAGFDGVELHGAHGYLLHQFLSTATNKRTDEWGGSFENRIRLLRTILKNIKAEVSTNFMVGVRLSPEDKYTFQGIDFDESLALAKILAQENADYIHLSPWDAFKKPEKYADGEKALISFFREAIPDTPIMVAGNIWSGHDAEKAIALGADIVAIGQAAIGHADWPTLVRDKSFEPSRPPYPVSHLLQQGLSATFVEYMKRWKNFVVAE